MMFSNFLSQFQPIASSAQDKETIPDPLGVSVPGYGDFMSKYSGVSMAAGMYRIHEVDDIEKWNEIISEAFPKFHSNFSSFGFDWLGRQFALDGERLTPDGPEVLMFEPGTGDVLEIPATFASFHDDEIVNHRNEALASEFFAQWFKNTVQLTPRECAGYKVPLFLGGEDNVDNLEVIEMEVYWVLSGQLLNQTRRLPHGTTIKQITIS